ncbi:hypothetical protein ACWEGQ_00340 [Streptomyces seoulensis]
MNLGEIITRLQAADPNQTIRHGFTNPHSYRGDYMDLAFEPATNVTVTDMLTAARSALNTTYQGYKGGTFTMTSDTWCWLSEYGDASGETISPMTLDYMLTQPAVEQPPVDRVALRDRIEVWPLTRVLAEVQCGSKDWSWDEEWADLDRRHAATGYLAKLEQQIRENGITMPVLVGSDGRLWDGHHRLRIAARLGIGYVPVELTTSADTVLPDPDARAAVDLTEVIDALTAKAGELSKQAEEEMRRDLEDQAQTWHEAAELARRVSKKATRRQAAETRQDGAQR